MPEDCIIHSTETERILREYARRRDTISADFYALDKPANSFAHSRLAQRVMSALQRNELLPLKGRNIVDVGCGAGNWLLEFMQWGADPADLHGIDLNPERIALAREGMPGVALTTCNATSMPFAEHSADLVCQFTAFSSVLDDDMRKAMAAEMLRLVRLDGIILWYDLRVDNPSNPAVRGIGAVEVRSLFPGCRFHVERATLAPPLARAIAPRSVWLASALERIPALRSHLLIVVRPGETRRTE